MILRQLFSSPLAEDAAIAYLSRIADALDDIANSLHTPAPDTEMTVDAIDDVLDSDPAPDESAGLEELDEHGE